MPKQRYPARVDTAHQPAAPSALRPFSALHPMVGPGASPSSSRRLAILFTDLVPEGPVAVWVAAEPGSDVLGFSGTAASLDGWTLRFVDGYHLELGNVFALASSPRGT